MRKTLNQLLCLMPVMLLIGCAAPLTKTDLNTIKSIAIVNEFPNQPNYAIIGTTIFNNEYDGLKSDAFLKKVSSVTIEYLSKKGYDVKEIDGKNKSNYKNYDFVLTLIPRDIYQMPGTYGYGVNQRSFLGIKGKPIIYVALNMRPELHGRVTGSAYYNQSTTELTFDTLPEKWSGLSESQKKEITEKLNENIEKAITELLGEVGI